ncbi:MAG: HyaD/HybD family hydrogenase maturation endopeptidase [Aquificae bacterium]|nr:HyaD/HybD family hydrogenase maturation endopeptidase [Aquificota bacterium]
MICVLGIGNLLLGDEGLGVVALKTFSELYEVGPGVQLLDGGTLGIDLMYYLEGVKKLLVIDAVSGGKEPGHFYRFEDDEVKRYFRNKVSMHEIGFQEVLALLELKGHKFDKLVLLGLEPARIELSLELSPVVKARLPFLVKQVADELKSWGAEVRKRAA